MNGSTKDKGETMDPAGQIAREVQLRADVEASKGARR